MISFVIVTYNDNYIDYLRVLLQSIKDVYYDRAHTVLYYANMSDEYISEIKERMPNCLVKEITGYNLKDGDYNWLASLKSAIWSDVLAENPQIDNAVCLDTDMLVIKPVEDLFERDFDISFCYKTDESENLNWPINGGLVLVKNSEQAIKFLKEWKDKTFAFKDVDEKTRKRKTRIWGGDDQITLGEMLGTRDKKQYGKPIMYKGTKLLGTPCEYVNEMRCVPISEKTHIIHYKGRWRPVLATNEFTQYRPREKCLHLFKLWKSTLERWNKTWSGDFEIAYWNSHPDDFYVKDILRLHEYFDVENKINEYFGDSEPEIVVDVGGGAFGGEFQFYKRGQNRILVDILCSQFGKLGKLPGDLKTFPNDFAEICLADKSIDIVFAWEVLDHATSDEHFNRGQQELCRILKPGGLLFFNQPIRSKMKPGHTVIFNEQWIKEGFKDLEILEWRINRETAKVPEGEICAIFRGKEICGK